MDLTQLANLGEFVGGVAVLVTLIYLAVQVRASAKTFRLSSFVNAKDQFNSVNMTIAAHPAAGEVFAKGAESLASLELSERFRFNGIMLSYMNIFERLFVESGAGAGSGLWNVEERSVGILLASYPGARQWWAENPYSYSKEFRARVDAILEEEDRLRAARDR